MLFLKFLDYRIVLLLGLLSQTAMFSVVRASYWFLEQLPLTALAHGQRPDSVDKICSSIPGMVPRQYRLCRNHPRIMVSMSDGAKMGLMECTNQFRFERWNCSSLHVDNGAKTPKAIRKVVRRATKETAFLFAISSAGVVHKITRSCSQGNLMECECDPKRKGDAEDQTGAFTWGGCSEHIRFGMKMARLFMDARDRRQRDARATMNLHNNKAGRRAVWRKKVKKCKCHGVSGACSMRTCWQKMEDFRLIGQIIKDRYKRAVRVTFNSRQKRLLADKTITGGVKSGGRSNKKGGLRKAPKNSLVFFEESPNYCQFNEKIGHPGIAGRECNISSTGDDSCDLLCCDRGYDTFEMDVDMNCDCKFYWCCHVRCKTCRERVTIHRCKALVEDTRRIAAASIKTMSKD